MLGLGNDLKTAGQGAAEELHRTADDALSTIDNQTIPAATAAARAILEQAVYGLAGVLADLTNRLNGAELPVDIEVSLTLTGSVKGKIGALKLNLPVDDTTVQPASNVVG